MSDAEAAIAARVTEATRPPRRSVWRWPVLAGIALLFILVGSWVVQNGPAAREIGAQVVSLEAWTLENPVLAVAILAAALFVSAAAATPFGGTITAIGGFLLGGFVSGATAVAVAPLGALVLFLVVRRTFGEGLRRRLATRFEPFLRGFQSDAVSYLLCLRLMPTPFWLVNISASVLGTRWSTFLWTTAVGIVPLTFAHAFAGAALGDALRAHRKAADACAAGDAGACAMQSTFAGMITPSTLLTIAALGLLALLPVVVRKLRARRRQVG